MNRILTTIGHTEFEVNELGYIPLPGVIKKIKMQIGQTTYQMGIGGLHSNEKKTTLRSDEHYMLVDKDVVSYYPRIILNQGLYPEHLGVDFLQVYRGIVEKRLAAKASGQKIVAETLKITINGSFGKLGSKYSILYSPQLLIQVTITGQLALLMLIERLELAGIPIASANTDGIVIRSPRSLHDKLNSIVREWECDTSFETEESSYLGIFSRDVNNYTALKEDSKIKGKGNMCLVRETQSGCKNNPVNEICIHAIRELLKKSIPISQTVRACDDIRQFITVRTVKGGAVKNGEYLGKTQEKAIRLNNIYALRFISRMEILLYEIANLSEEELQDALPLLKQIISDTNLIMEVKALQRLLKNSKNADIVS